MDVAPDRLGRWAAGFAERHGPGSATVTGDGLEIVAADGTRARFHLPFGWPGGPASAPAAASVAEPLPPDDQAHLADALVEALVAAAMLPRRFGLLLARRGATAAAVVAGDRLLATKVDTRHVQGRTAAGGWSQQRFARRRDNQARAAARSGAAMVADLLLPAATTLDGLVPGGDRHAVDAILADPRLAPLAALRTDRFLDVAAPRRAALEAAVAAARAVRVHLTDPDPGNLGQNA